MKCLASITLLLMAASVPVYGQHKTCARIQFQHEVFNFDTITIDTNSYSCLFHFTNTGDAPLIITDVTSSCGCTVAEYPTDPIIPQSTGTIEVTYNAMQLGSFVKTILVKSNDPNTPKKAMQIKGHVKEKRHKKCG